MAVQKTNVIRPSRWYYGLALLVLLCGNLVSIPVVLKGLGEFEKHRHQLIVPGEHLLELSKPGNYTIFFEHRSIVNGKVFHTDPDTVPSLRCSLFTESDTQIELVPNTASAYTHLKRLAGRSLFDFKIHEPGRYVLKADYEDGAKKPEIVLTVAEGFTAGLFRTLGVLGLICIITIGLTGYIVYKTFVKRRRCRPALET